VDIFRWKIPVLVNSVELYANYRSLLSHWCILFARISSIYCHHTITLSGICHIIAIQFSLAHSQFWFNISQNILLKPAWYPTMMTLTVPCKNQLYLLYSVAHMNRRTAPFLATSNIWPFVIKNCHQLCVVCWSCVVWWHVSVCAICQSYKNVECFTGENCPTIVKTFFIPELMKIF
jgi:hypothetical protein